MHAISLCCILVLSFVHSLAHGSPAGRSLNELSNPQISALAQSPNPSRNLDPSDLSSHLFKILIPRPPDTDNNTLVRNYIVSTMEALDWHVETTTFSGPTPYGEKTFTNVVATKDPEAARRVVVAAHFDSKFFSTYPQNQFVGATDSAVPCAIMLDLAETLDSLLEGRRELLEADLFSDEEAADITLQLVFFDGEEAFKDWTSTDSIYGSRYLADKWANTYIPPHTKRRLRPSATEISTIDHFILLDLLGAPNPTIMSYFPDTAWLFDAMISAEKRLAMSGAFGSAAQVGDFRSFFIPRKGDERSLGFIEDDHVPFMKKGVSVLHIIASPFPRVWHTLRDDASALDLETMRRWNMIMRVFMSEYLGLVPFHNSSTESIRSLDELTFDAIY